jgi:type IV pilus assembly protein PilY1
VREYRTPGSVRGRSGNWPFYLDSILYYKTGTAYYKNIIGYETGPLGTDKGMQNLKMFDKSVSLGYGLSASPSLHVGKRGGAKVMVQTSTGEIRELDEQNLPESFKSRPLHWIERGQ